MRSLGPRTLLYPTPVLLVGTYDQKERPNIMTAAWGGICCSKPPCVTVSLRKATYSYASIMAQKAYTLSLPSLRYAREADYAGIYSGKDEDKFATLGLTPVRSTLVHAPYVGEFPMVLECALLHTLEIGLHTQFVGEVLDVKVAEECLDAEGRPDPRLVDPLIFAPESQLYFGLGELVGKAFSMGKKGRSQPGG
jgi:flavin reductase (DIM6/NTAB) family NADH-FMN oxidoreductase RutF